MDGWWCISGSRMAGGVMAVGRIDGGGMAGGWRDGG